MSADAPFRSVVGEQLLCCAGCLMWNCHCSDSVLIFLTAQLFWSSEKVIHTQPFLFRPAPHERVWLRFIMIISVI